MKKILFCAAVLMLSACGFHLKGSGGISGALPYQAWHVQGGEMQQALATALRYANGRAVAAPEAEAEVVVTRFETRRDVSAITRAAVINEYMLTLNVVAQARRNGADWGAPMNITVNRKMDYADNEVLGKQEESGTVWGEMRADAAEQIVRRLSFLKAAE